MLETTIEKLPSIIAGFPNRYTKIAVSTLNGVAFHALKGLKDELKNKIDRPTPYTLNAFYYRKATDDNLEAVITTRSEGKGTKPNKFLAPLVYGTTRNAKGFESMFRMAGILPSNGYYIPTEHMPQDAYGNPKPTELIKILSNTKAFTEQGYTANASKAAKSKKKRQIGSYFARFTEANDVAPTIFKRSGEGILPVLFPTNRTPKYKKIIDFEGAVTKAYDANIDKEFDRAYEKYGIL